MVRGDKYLFHVGLGPLYSVSQIEHFVARLFDVVPETIGRPVEHRLRISHLSVDLAQLGFDQRIFHFQNGLANLMHGRVTMGKKFQTYKCEIVKRKK